jgi:cytochrome bd-type quinol oxidase subunit 2
MNRWISALLLTLSAGIFAGIVTWLPFAWGNHYERDGYFYFRVILNPVLVLLALGVLAPIILAGRTRNQNETAITAIRPVLAITSWICLSFAAISHILAWLTASISWFQTANIIILAALVAAWLLIAAFLAFSSGTEAAKEHHSRAQPFQ